MRKFATYKEAAQFAQTLANRYARSVSVKRDGNNYLVEEILVEGTFHEIDPAERFSDQRRYPHGFSRSGDFTIHQAALIEENGTKVLFVQNGKPQPMTQQHVQEFIRAFGSTAIDDGLVRAWDKYQSKVNAKNVQMFRGKGGAFTDENGDLIGPSTIIPQGSLTKRHK